MQDMLVDTSKRIRLGTADYVWRGGQLHDADGRLVPLRAKSLRMFAALLNSCGTTIAKDRLCDIVWPDVVATDESIARCIADIRKALDDSAHRIVETFPKQGYRLNASPAPSVDIPARLVRLGVPLTVCGVLAIGGVWGLSERVGLPDAADPLLLPVPGLREAVGIVPFTAIGEDSQFLAAALSDDIELHLAEMSGIKFVSQAQTIAASVASAGPVAVAQALDASYLVTGSVRHNGADIAVSLQLVDGSDGTTVWADLYEGPRSGLVGFRHDLPGALVGAMSIALDERDRRRLAIRDTADPVAFEEVMQARRALSAFTYEDSLVAERHLRLALERDPGYARAYAELAAAFAIRLENQWVILSAADSEKAFYFGRKALELDPELWLAHYALGRLHSVAPTGDLDVAFQHLRTAMSLQPANDDARVYSAVVRMLAGRPEEALPLLESVMASHPRPPFWYHLGLGNAFLHLHRYDEAEKALTACLVQMPNSPYCQRSLIATYARLGRPEDAAWMVAEYEINGHDSSLHALMDRVIERDPEIREHLRRSYMMAGLK